MSMKRETISIIILVAISFSISLFELGCHDDGGSEVGNGQNGGSNGDGGMENPIEIIWVDEQQPLITYVYAGSQISAINFHRNLNVVRGSGNIQISANLKDELDSVASIDQIEDTFFVEEGFEYEIIVDVSIGAQIRCTPSDYDFMILSSPSAPEPIETAIPPMLEGDPTTNQIDAFCLFGYAINSMRLN